MSALHAEDDDLTGLLGHEIESSSQPGARYRLSRVLGAGGMAVVFFAIRFAADAELPVVLKIIRPEFVEHNGATAVLSFQKEAEALGRLNELVPPPAHVVRLVDAGSVEVGYRGRPLQLSWIALEHVSGGHQGTTLEQRVSHQIRCSGHAFECERADRAIRHLVSGLSAVHAAGVYHRDVKPSNVLCSGSGPEELFKLADFGVARPVGMAATFGGILVGTPGHAAPEQAALDVKRIGPWTDVFGLATVIYHLLTGEDYFQLESPADAMLVIQESARRRLGDAEGLAPTLRRDSAACTAIDAILARATQARANKRLQSVAELAASILPALRASASFETEHQR